MATGLAVTKITYIVSAAKQALRSACRNPYGADATEWARVQLGDVSLVFRGTRLMLQNS